MRADASRFSSLLVITCLPAMLAAVCNPPEPGDSDDEDTGGIGDTGETGETGETGDTEETGEPEMISATVTGAVTVSLYQAGEDGELESLSWEDGTGGEYIFGKIFVAAYYTDDEGVDQYAGTTVIEKPTTSANAYELALEMDEARDVYVYAVLDYYQDSVVGNNEPRGVWPRPIPLGEGDTAEDIDIEILTGLYGGGGCDAVAVSGDVTVTSTWAGGDAAVMLMTTGGVGPLYSTWSTLSADGGGALGAYALGVCQGVGETKLIGCWDSNGNGMADPSDRWGVYVSEPDVDGNPITVESTDLTGLDVQIPYGDGRGISVIPFVSISGSVGVLDGTFDDLPAGTEVHVAAFKYRPSGDIDISASMWTYDVQSYAWPDLVGQSEVDFDLVTPSDTIVYLWAMADTDADGIVNESGEPVAAAGSDGNGRFPTGTSSSGGNLLLLSPYVEDTGE